MFEYDGRFASRPLPVAGFDEARAAGVPGGRYRRAEGKLLCVWEDGRRLEGAVVVEDYAVTVDGKRFERADFDLTGASLDGAWRTTQGPGLWFAADGRFTDVDRPEAGGSYALGPHTLDLRWLDGRVESRSFYSDLAPSPVSPDVLWIAGARYERA